MNQEGFKLLTTFEGLELEAYDDGGGVWTIGYGHTKGVFEGMTITQTQADQFLRDDLEIFESYVNDVVNVSLNDDQFSALVCFCFNVGQGSAGFGGSTLLKLLNQSDYTGAAEQFTRWNKVNGKAWLGLTRRRLAEQALFNSQPWGPFRNYNGPVEVFGTKPAEVFEAKEDRVLKLSDPIMKGEDVRRLQKALIDAGFFVGASGADGSFGEATDKAVRQLQAQKNLTIDGLAGSKTLQALNL
ncbi:MAG: glycoside hydrolase family protein [Cyanobacteria bacterium P01_A01_bin.137]